MRALYFCPVSFFFLSCFFLVISAAADWMSTILAHMVWPSCEFRMQVSNALHAARWKIQDAKKSHFGTLHNFVGLYLPNEGMCRQPKKTLLNSNTYSTCPDNMMNFGLLTAEICCRVLGTPANFNGFRVLAALLHGTLIVGVSQTLLRWTEVATYIRQGGHHIGHSYQCTGTNFKCYVAPVYCARQLSYEILPLAVHCRAETIL